MADVFSKDTVKRAMMAEAYGMGDIKVGQVTGQYPNPSLFPPQPTAPKELWPTITGRVVHRGPETQYYYGNQAVDRSRREHKPVEIVTDYTEIEKRVLALMEGKTDGNR